MPATDSGFREDIVAWGLIAALAVLLCSEIPQIAPAERETLARIGSGLILLLIGLTREFQEKLPIAVRRGPTPAILLLFGWSVFEFFHSPFRSYAITEMMRVFDGVGAYFLCAYCLKAPRQTGLMAAGTLFLGCAVALLTIGHIGAGNPGPDNNLAREDNLFGTHQNVGSLLMLLFPVSLAVAVTPGVEEKRRLAAIAAALVIGAGLLIAQPRSAWIGSLFGLALLALLVARSANAGRLSAKPNRRPATWKSRLSAMLGSPLTLSIAAALIFLFVAGGAPIVASRLSTLRGVKSDASFTGRVEVWAGAARMVSEAPLIGRGLGSYQVIQGRWTHFGTEIERALSVGVGDENMAHDYYLQWAADCGAIGLFLYLTAIGVFLGAGCRAAQRVTEPAQRAVLCGCLAAVTAASVDAVATPAYYFHGISTLYWCLLGIGVANMRPAQGRPSSQVNSGEAISAAAPPLIWFSASLAAAIVVLGILQIGPAIRKRGEHMPRGRFEIGLQAPSSPVYPGQTLRWTAFFHDAKGVDCSTMPGTIWNLTSSDPAALGHPKIRIEEYTPVSNSFRHEALSLVAPSMAGTLTMHARYADQYGRWYDAYSMQDVRKGK